MITMTCVMFVRYLLRLKFELCVFFCWFTAYFKEQGCAYSDELEETVMALQSDKDRDVRFFASLDPSKGLLDTASLT